MARRRKPGRPKGSTNREYETAEVVVSRCLKCGSTNRLRYGEMGEPRVVKHNGVHDGVAYARVVWRKTKCIDCGQHRIDKSWE